MKKRLALLCAALCVAVPLVTPTLAADAEIHIEERNAENGVRFCRLKLSGADTDGSVFVTVYSESGQMKRFAQYEAAPSVSVMLDGVEDADNVRAIWVRGDFAPVAVVDLVWPHEVETKSYEEFAKAVMNLTRNCNVLRNLPTKEDSVGEYALARLIVSSKAPLPSLREYPYISRISDAAGHTVLQFSTAAEAKACAEYLRKRLPPGGYAEPDALISIEPMEGEDCGENVSDAVMSWGVSVIHADEQAATLLECGIRRTVTVAVVDSGVDGGNPLFEGRLKGGYDFIDDDDDPTDEYRHGTHVAGIIVDCTRNLDIRIMPVRVTDERGQGSLFGVSAGIIYAADNGADVINLSFGGDLSHYIDEAVEYAISKGVVVVASAGNDKKNVKDYSPAHLEACITVSAVDKSLNPASFSNYGKGVDLAAPGVDITSCVLNGERRTLRGTSQAAPHVSACAAMLLSEFPDLTPAEVKERLTSEADKPSGWDMKYGKGLVDMRESSKRFYALFHEGTDAPSYEPLPPADAPSYGPLPPA